MEIETYTNDTCVRRCSVAYISYAYVYIAMIHRLMKSIIIASNGLRESPMVVCGSRSDQYVIITYDFFVLGALRGYALCLPCLLLNRWLQTKVKVYVHVFGEHHELTKWLLVISYNISVYIYIGSKSFLFKYIRIIQYIIHFKTKSIKTHYFRDKYRYIYT